MPHVMSYHDITEKNIRGKEKIKYLQIMSFQIMLTIISDSVYIEVEMKDRFNSAEDSTILFTTCHRPVSYLNECLGEKTTEYEL
jgi:hypothetical protein